MGDKIDMKTSLATLALRGFGHAVDVFSGGRGCFFTFHRAAASKAWEGLPNRNFYLDLTFLDQLLGYLKSAGWEIVTIEQGMEYAESGARNRRYVNFSIDDCYRDTYEDVVPLFRRHNAPVTLFVTTGIPDGTLALWGAGLEDYIISHSSISVDGRTWEVDTNEKKRAAYLEIERLWDGPDAGLHYRAFCAANAIDEKAVHGRHAITWDMLEELARDPLVEIGSHTVSHPRMSELTVERALAEFKESRSRLHSKLGTPSPYFAFPYGRAADCATRDFEIAKSVGYAGVATTRKGVVRSGSKSYHFPRNTLNGAHKSVLLAELHLTGITGLAARVAGRV